MKHATVTPKMVEAADRLQAWSGLHQLGVDEVLIWSRGHDHVGVAMRGDALRIERYALRATAEDGQPIRNVDHFFDIALQRAMGFDARPERHGHYVSIEDGLGQLLDDDSTSAAQVLDAIAKCVRYYLDPERAPDELPQVSATLMPKQGAPWTPLPGQTTTTYYSAKKQREHVSEKPPWIIEAKTREGVPALGADFCQIAPRIEQCGEGSVIGRLPKGLGFMVAHSMSLAGGGAVKGKTLDDNAKAIKRCGGLLYPSLSVGEIPASNFGPYTLVADVGVALAGLKPYREGRGNWPITVYSSDVWTETSSAFFGEAAVALYEQLTGTWEVEPYAYEHMWVLGPLWEAQERATFAPGAALVRDVATLQRKLAQRSAQWPRGMAREAFSQLREETESEHWYGYAEAKSAAVISLACFPVAVCPAALEAPFKKMLRAAGWKGVVLAIRTDPAFTKTLVEGDNYDGYLWAWMVRDAVHEYAAKQKLVRDVHAG